MDIWGLLVVSYELRVSVCELRVEEKIPEG